MSAVSFPVGDSTPVCRHCGLPCDSSLVSSPRGTFCCQGCEAVFQLLAARDLTAYYDGDTNAGTSQKRRAAVDADRFAGLDDPDVLARYLQFDDGHDSGGDVRGAGRALRVVRVAARAAVALRSRRRRAAKSTSSAAPSGSSSAVPRRRCGRSPSSSPRSATSRVMDGERPAGTVPRARRRLYLQLGVAGFAFGNIMLFSIPRYANGTPLDDGFQSLFDALNVASRAPGAAVQRAPTTSGPAGRRVRARDDHASKCRSRSAWRCCSARSLVDIVARPRPGFPRLVRRPGLLPAASAGCSSRRRSIGWPSTARSARSCRCPSTSSERRATRSRRRSARLQPGDCLVLRRREIVPADAALLDADAAVDYRFLTGEQTPVLVRAGERVRAGGRARDARCGCVSCATPSESQLASALGQPALRRGTSTAGSPRPARASAPGSRSLAIGLARGRRDRLVARRRRQRQRRHGGADHRVPVRADARRADHARHRDGPARTTRPVSEGRRRRARSEPHRHRRLRQDRHADDGRVSWRSSRSAV